ncbi:1318_t:CDS:2 [Cetraspora pellucida]|uniref:1318_t:CDS:1 n=1 Tax=Cetraspora pellucida TaxID=1433469 RepID=A0ACA9NRI2_9GLOM|nr:1318_t:CDS:2 [Cetraspora pellucida]
MTSFAVDKGIFTETVRKALNYIDIRLLVVREPKAHRGHRCACECPSPLCLTQKLDLALRGSCGK